ncbi:uncharacterized protein CLUP02_07720 [Colletotrichum lupini]|uniref:Uncharacterized protein n=1 Tax=Colletotrichum lupini TaxID=145971 RepID=A0A9Q8SS52_9PEZI|nr:uncharacterized protein CLUP02_07720 [Colletotrichum lupini]UQC82233.1 hypothetical protein CLUP02_07720 [Colletotrichum lupini]
MGSRGPFPNTTTFPGRLTQADAVTLFDYSLFYSLSTTNRMPTRQQISRPPEVLFSRSLRLLGQTRTRSYREYTHSSPSTQSPGWIVTARHSATRADLSCDLVSSALSGAAHMGSECTLHIGPRQRERNGKVSWPADGRPFVTLVFDHKTSVFPPLRRSESDEIAHAPAGEAQPEENGAVLTSRSPFGPLQINTAGILGATAAAKSTGIMLSSRTVFESSRPDGQTGNVAIAMLSFHQKHTPTPEVRAIFISSVAARAVWGLTLRVSPLRLGACPMPLGLP